MENRYKIPYSKITIGKDEITKVTNCLESGWLTMGNNVVEFENNFSKYTGAKHAIAVSSCTAGLHLSLKVIGVEPGDEVILSPMTFVSAANVIEYCGAIPVFVDIDPHTYNITAESIEAAITKKTKAIMIVHYGGHPCDMDKINSISKKYNIAVVEDAAHAVGAEYRGKKIGNSDNIVCFSFYPTKSMTTAEGGMITTNDSHKAELLRKMRLHGLSSDAWKRYGNTVKWRYDVELIGYKYNMPDILAAIGIVQLSKLDYFQRKRRQIAHKYDAFFANYTDLIDLQINKEEIGHSHFLYPICLKNGNIRDELINYLQKNGIQVSVLFVPIYKFSYYASKYHYNELDYPICEKYFEGLICLPIYPSLSEKDIDYIQRTLKNFLMSIL